MGDCRQRYGPIRVRIADTGRRRADEAAVAAPDGQESAVSTCPSDGSPKVAGGGHTGSVAGAPQWETSSYSVCMSRTERSAGGWYKWSRSQL